MLSSVQAWLPLIRGCWRFRFWSEGRRDICVAVWSADRARTKVFGKGRVLVRTVHAQACLLGRMYYMLRSRSPGGMALQTQSLLAPGAEAALLKHNNIVCYSAQGGKRLLSCNVVLAPVLRGRDRPGVSPVSDVSGGAHRRLLI